MGACSDVGRRRLWRRPALWAHGIATYVQAIGKLQEEFVYVADTANSRIEVFNASDGAYAYQWGSSGAGAGHFNTPTGVATDSSGNVYVADNYNNRIQKFDSSAHFVLMWGKGVDATTGADLCTAASHDTCQAGTTGSASGQFNGPYGVGTDSSGNVYVADTNNLRIVKSSSSGTYMAQWHTQCNAYVLCGGYPYGVAVDASGAVYVADESDQQVEKYNSSGQLLTSWQPPSHPYGVATDSSGNVYVGQPGNSQDYPFVYQHTSAGTFLARVTQLTAPIGVATDPSGDVFVADNSTNQVTEFRDKRSTATSLSCSPNPVAIGAATSCVATVSDTDTGTTSVPIGTVSFGLQYQPNTSGTFSPTSCTLAATATPGQESCSVNFTPTTVSPAHSYHNVNAVDQGDYDHLTSAGTFKLTARRGSATSVGWSPASIVIGQATSCTATVTDASAGTASTPSGTVSFASDSSGSYFSALSCTLTPTTTSGQASCSVSYTQNAAGTGTVTARYAGDDGTHVPSSASFAVSAAKQASATSVSCSPASVSIGSTTSCTAAVPGTGPGMAESPPSGTVSFASSATGSVGATVCMLPYTLTANSCSVTYTPGALGVHTITSSYQGDQNHLTSAGSFDVSAGKRASATSVSCSPGSLTVGNASTFTATVGDADTGTPIRGRRPLRAGR